MEKIFANNVTRTSQIDIRRNNNVSRLHFAVDNALFMNESQGLKLDKTNRKANHKLSISFVQYEFYSKTYDCIDGFQVSLLLCEQITLADSNA